MKIKGTIIGGGNVQQPPIDDFECDNCADLKERLAEAEAETARYRKSLADLVAARIVPTIDEMAGLVPNMTEGLSLKEYMKRLSDES